MPPTSGPHAPDPAAVFEASPIALLLVDEHGVMTLVNRHAEQLFGYARVELVGQSVEMLIPTNRDGVGVHKDGREVPLEIGLTPIRTDHGSFVLTAIVDITQRRPAEEALRLSEQRAGERRRAEDHEATANTLREILLRSAGDDMFADALDLVRARFASRFGFLGYIRQSDGALVCPSMTRDIWEACAVAAKSIEFPRATWGGLWGRVLVERTALIKNELHRTPAGHVPLHRSMGAPLVVDGELIGSIHLANREQDYTPADLDALVQLCAVLAPTLRLWLHRRDAEALAHQAQQQREELIATVEGIVWEADAASFVFTFVSAQAERLLGYPARLWLESPTFWVDHIHPHDRERAVDYCVTCTAEARDHSFEYRMLAADGRVVWLHDVVTVVVDSGRATKLRGIMMDITERKRAEAERARLEAQLRQAQKMEAMGTLAGGIAHDFNNILAAILGNATLAIAELGPDHPALGCLEAIQVSGDRATDLIRQILAFSRQERAQMEVISLRTIVEDDARLLRATLPAGVEFVTRLSACPSILADRTEIHQVLMNLCTNAWHAMDGRPGKSIVLTLDAVEVDADLALAHADLRPGPYARLTVSDTGSGMDAAVVERIFEPFFTTKAVGDGTGLGLFVVLGVMKRHLGAVTVASQPGRGTSVEVWFPAVAEAAPGTSAPSLAAAPLGAGRHLLFIDDEVAIVRVTARLLERVGYQVSGFTSVADALVAFRADPSWFDVVVTDYNMPGMSGLEVARAFRDLRPDLSVVLISGFLTAELEAAAAAAGIGKVLHKPFTTDDLYRAVDHLLSSKPSG